MKKLVIILGMRSGTSLTAQISQRMGAYLGEMEELMGAALGNPDGHFENLDVVHMNDNILHFCDREWYSLETPVLDYNSPQMKQAMQEIKEIIQKLFEKSDTVAIKDPRISVLLPIWDKVLNELDIELRYIWVFRNPLEVMESLRKRDGYCSRYVLMLWIHHNLSILKYLQEREYLLINYKDILGQSQALEKLGQVLDRQIDDDLKRELKQIIKQRYCHSEHSYLDVKNTRNKLLSDLYGVLLERQEAEVNVPEWEKRYEEMVTKTEDPFLDYEAMDNIRCLEGKEIVIYGAGNYGRRTAGMLRQLGFLNYNFCDKDIQKQGQNLMDGRVLSVAELENRKNALIIVAIENETSRKEMEQTLAYIDGVSFLSFFALEEAYNILWVTIKH
ncbi:MAG: hypothetical protein HFH53_00580 [Hespellia sp.]|nr:hypothetical protein [Hespellia sp.]